MSSTFTVHDDGSVRSVPDQHTLDRNERLQLATLTVGRLCTACLVGSWPHTLLRSRQTICDTCRILEAALARRAGTPLRLAPAHVRDDDAALERARAHRARRVGEVFDRAERLGVDVARTARWDGTPLRAAEARDLHRPDLLDDGYEARVVRFAAWLRDLAPGAYADHAATLQDVGGLAAELEATERRNTAERARIELDDAERAVAGAEERLADARTEVARLRGDV
jgi:hypothetical protein